MIRTVILSLCVLGLLPVTFARGQSAAPAQEDTAALRKEVQELRQQLEEQRKANEAQMKALQDKMDALGAAQQHAGTGQGAAASQPPQSAEEDLNAAVKEAQGGGTKQAGASGSTGGQELNAAIEEAKSGSAAPASGVFAAPSGGGGGGIQSFNPDISVVGDFQGHFGKDSDRLFVRELEFGISGNIDPYLRANSILSVHPKDDPNEGYDIEIEEAYVSPFNMPFDLTAKLGQFRAGFGKVNEMHQHALPWPDYPLVNREFLGDDGLVGDGASFSWLVPHTGKLFVELTGQSFHKTSSSLLAGDDASHWVNLVHLKTFADINKESTIEAGFSAAGMVDANVEGVDLTYRWRPEKEGKYKSFQWITEIMASQNKAGGETVNSWGMFTGPEYQFAERWSVGLRYDYAQRPYNSDICDQDIGAYVTFKQTEFAYWRLGYVHCISNDPSGGSRTDNQVMLQLDFTLGPHPAHKY